MVAVRDVIKVRRISPTGATRRTGRAILPGPQQLVAVGPVWAQRAIRGGQGAVGVAGGAAAVAGRTDGRRARTGSREAVGAFRASIGGAGDGAPFIVNVTPLRDQEGGQGGALEIGIQCRERYRRQRKRRKQKRKRRRRLDGI